MTNNLSVTDKSNDGIAKINIMRIVDKFASVFMTGFWMEINCE